MYGFQAVADVGQRAAHDDAHGVVEIRLAHLVFEIHGKDFARDFVHVRARKKVRDSSMVTLRKALFSRALLTIPVYNSRAI